MSDDYFKIGEVAERLGTTVRTIRYYEEQELLLPFRTHAGTRLYSEHQIDRLEAILRLAENGFALEDIGLIARARLECSTGDKGRQRLTTIINQAINDIDETLTGLKALKSDLKASTKWLAQCAGCQNQPSSKGCPECPINQQLKKLTLLNLIWE